MIPEWTGRTQKPESASETLHVKQTCGTIRPRWDPGVSVGSSKLLTWWANAMYWNSGKTARSATKTKHKSPPSVNSINISCVSVTIMHNDRTPHVTSWLQMLKKYRRTPEEVTASSPESGLLPPQLSLLLVSDDSCMKTWERSSWLRAAELNLPASSTGSLQKALLCQMRGFILQLRGAKEDSQWLTQLHVLSYLPVTAWVYSADNTDHRKILQF